jgi:hypothetical protein
MTEEKKLPQSRCTMLVTSDSRARLARIEDETTVPAGRVLDVLLAMITSRLQAELPRSIRKLTPEQRPEKKGAVGTHEVDVCTMAKRYAARSLAPLGLELADAVDDLLAELGGDLRRALGDHRTLSRCPQLQAAISRAERLVGSK